MNVDKAAELATEISQCWRNGIATHIWEKELLLYSDVSRAWKAVERLKRTERFSPVIATFHDAYHLAPSSEGQGAPTVCGDCNDDGWISDQENMHVDRPPTSAARPCTHCRHGKKAAESTIWKNRPTAQQEHTP